jgi:hypothetical protein
MTVFNQLGEYQMRTITKTEQAIVSGGHAAGNHAASTSGAGSIKLGALSMSWTSNNGAWSFSYNNGIESGKIYNTGSHIGGYHNSLFGRMFSC